VTITALTTLDIAIELTNNAADMLAIYSRTLEEKPDHEGSRQYDMAQSITGPFMTVNIDNHLYEVSGVILPRPVNSDVSEITMIALVKASLAPEPNSYYVFSFYTQYSMWSVKMDVLYIEDDDEVTFDDFLNFSIHDKQRLLGLV
jgi:hypothetical protein